VNIYHLFLPHYQTTIYSCFSNSSLLFNHLSLLALNLHQWIFTIAVASISIPLGALLRGINIKEFQQPKLDHTERAREGWKFAKRVLTQVCYID
jgi:hypothetical protein